MEKTLFCFVSSLTVFLVSVFFLVSYYVSNHTPSSKI